MGARKTLRSADRDNEELIWREWRRQFFCDILKETSNISRLD